MADVPPYTEEERATKIRMNVPEDVDVKLWEDYRELLAQDIDVAILCTDVKDHADIASETLARGIHTVVEKPMAIDMADAKRMYRAYKRSTAELIINWPIAWFPGVSKGEGAFRQRRRREGFARAVQKPLYKGAL